MRYRSVLHLQRFASAHVQAHTSKILLIAIEGTTKTTTQRTLCCTRVADISVLQQEEHQLSAVLQRGQYTAAALHLRITQRVGLGSMARGRNGTTLKVRRSAP